MVLTEEVTFAGGGAALDRAGHLRPEAGRLLTARGAALLPVWQGKPLIDLTGAAALGWVPTDRDILAHAAEPPVFLGMSDGKPCFTADVSQLEELNADDIFCGGLCEGAKFIDLRSIAPELLPGAAAMAATAKGVLEWHRTHRFCARCGNPSTMDEGGWRRRCGTCDALHFPRTDPVVIMAVLDQDNVLLGRQSVWPEGMWSLLAGFMEPGETVEDAVRRETLEETGVKVGKVGYLASQPWPFPTNLMIGCQAKALTRKITVDATELEDAQWISRAKMQVIMEDRHPKIRPPRLGAIARSILLDWVAERIPPL